MDRGEIDMFESMEALLAMYSHACDESVKSARRARIRHQWAADGQDCVFDGWFEEEEKAALAKLKEVQFWAGFEEFSDDEGGEGEVSVERQDNDRKRGT